MFISFPNKTTKNSASPNSRIITLTSNRFKDYINHVDLFVNLKLILLYTFCLSTPHIKRQMTFSVILQLCRSYFTAQEGN